MSDYANIENLRLFGTADLNLAGDGGANVLVGNAGANRLRGGAGQDRLKGFAGDDILIGGSGRDTLTGGTGEDLFVFSKVGHSTTANADTITDFVQGEDLIDLSALVSGNVNFIGGGAFGASGDAEVRQVLPNGNLFVEGNRVVQVHDDEVHYYVSGVCRPRDIDENNQVPSSQMLDVQVEISCRGPVCTASKRGWLGRVIDWLWPL